MLGFSSSLSEGSFPNTPSMQNRMTRRKTPKQERKMIQKRRMLFFIDNVLRVRDLKRCRGRFISLCLVLSFFQSYKIGRNGRLKFGFDLKQSGNLWRKDYRIIRSVSPYYCGRLHPIWEDLQFPR